MKKLIQKIAGAHLKKSWFWSNPVEEHQEKAKEKLSPTLRKLFYLAKEIKVAKATQRLIRYLSSTQSRELLGIIKELRDLKISGREELLLNFLDEHTRSKDFKKFKFLFDNGFQHQLMGVAYYLGTYLQYFWVAHYLEDMKQLKNFD